jgi:hypothetical protein
MRKAFVVVTIVVGLLFWVAAIVSAESAKMPSSIAAARDMGGSRSGLETVVDVNFERMSLHCAGCRSRYDAPLWMRSRAGR